MFRGIASLVVDVKGRLSIPARYRDSIPMGKSPHLIITIDTESPSLLLYPLKEWEFIEEKLQQLPSFNPATRRIQRLLLGHASELEMDSAGRVLLPTPLREYANLDKKAVLLGQGKKLELWDEDNWKTQRERWLSEERHKNPEQLPAELADLSL